MSSKTRWRRMVPAGFALLLLSAVPAWGDTPPPGAVKAKLHNGAGNKAITSHTSGGDEGIDIYLLNPDTASCREAGGNLETIEGKLVQQVLGLGDPAAGVRSACVLGNNAGQIDYGSGDAGAQTPRVALDGTKADGVTAPTGAVGAIGWLSGIYQNSTDIETLLASLMSAANSTTTPLGSGGTFTGAWVASSDYTAINLLVRSDQSGTLYVDFSADGVTAHHMEAYTFTPTSPGTPNGTHLQAMAGEGAYIRIRYTNGGTAQGEFVLNTVLKRRAGVGEVHEIGRLVSDTTDALVIKGVIYGKTTGGGGGYVAVKVTPSGALTVNASDSTTHDRIGATDETAAASDTATSGLNGLIKRLLQRLTTLFGSGLTVHQGTPGPDASPWPVKVTNTPTVNVPSPIPAPTCTAIPPVTLQNTSVITLVAAATGLRNNLVSLSFNNINTSLGATVKIKSGSTLLWEESYSPNNSGAAPTFGGHVMLAGVNEAITGELNGTVNGIQVNGCYKQLP